MSNLYLLEINFIYLIVFDWPIQNKNLYFLNFFSLAPNIDLFFSNFFWVFFDFLLIYDNDDNQREHFEKIFFLKNLGLLNTLGFYHPLCLFLYILLSFFFLKQKHFFLKKNFYSKLDGLFAVCSFILGVIWSSQELLWNGFWNWDLVEFVLFNFLLLNLFFFHFFLKKNYIFSFLNYFFSLFLLLIFYFIINRTPLVISIHSFSTSFFFSFNKIYIHTFLLILISYFFCKQFFFFNYYQRFALIYYYILIFWLYIFIILFNELNNNNLKIDQIFFKNIFTFFNVFFILYFYKIFVLDFFYLNYFSYTFILFYFKFSLKKKNFYLIHFFFFLFILLWVNYKNAILFKNNDPIIYALSLAQKNFFFKQIGGFCNADLMYYINFSYNYFFFFKVFYFNNGIFFISSLNDNYYGMNIKFFNIILFALFWNWNIFLKSKAIGSYKNKKLLKI